MKLRHILKAFANADQIAEGIKNNIWKKQHIEEIAKFRWASCKTCSKLDTKGDECAVKGTQPCCSDCGCSLGLKLRALSSDCPIGRWKELMDEETEDKIKESIDQNEQPGKDNKPNSDIG
tara:strand:- start:382 stop:741 length:360 start_codon:yes stop_codon:yes gene_type:complete